MLTTVPSMAAAPAGPKLAGALPPDLINAADGRPGPVRVPGADAGVFSWEEGAKALTAFSTPF